MVLTSFIFVLFGGNVTTSLWRPSASTCSFSYFLHFLNFREYPNVVHFVIVVRFFHFLAFENYKKKWSHLGNRWQKVSDPIWDGNPRGWRRYQKEVLWYCMGQKKHARKLLAPRLIAKLTGPARLLAMSWNQADFTGKQGVAMLLKKLSASPLVRKNLPNTQAIMNQYFNYKQQGQRRCKRESKPTASLQCIAKPGLQPLGPSSKGLLGLKVPVLPSF